MSTDSRGDGFSSGPGSSGPTFGVRNALPIGTTIRSFEILEVLGEGGFGKVYLSRDNDLDKEVAIKEYFPEQHAKREGNSVLPIPGSTKSFDSGRKQFIREAKTLASCRHLNIVEVYDQFSENHTEYMVMEYLGKETLNHHRQKYDGKIPYKRIREIIGDVASALDLVHSIGKVHRDLSPDNIMIREDGSPVLLDFGNVRDALQEVADSTKTRQKSTTHAAINDGYSPLELYITAKKDFGPETDIYALSATIYHVISDVKPSPSTAMFDEEQVSISKLDLNGPFPKSFLKTIDHGMMHKREERPQTIAEFLELLDGEQKTPGTPLIPHPKLIAAGLVGLMLVGGVGYFAYQQFVNVEGPEIVAQDPQFAILLGQAEETAKRAQETSDEAERSVEEANRKGTSTTLTESSVKRAQNAARQAQEALQAAQEAVVANNLPALEVAVREVEVFRQQTQAALDDVNSILEATNRNKQQQIAAEVQRAQAAAGAAALNVELATTAVQAAAAGGTNVPETQGQLDIAQEASQNASRSANEAQQALQESDLAKAREAAGTAEGFLDVTKNARAEIRRIIAKAQDDALAVQISELAESAVESARLARENSQRAVELVTAAVDDGIDVSGASVLVDEVRAAEVTANREAENVLSAQSLDAAEQAVERAAAARTASDNGITALEEELERARRQNLVDSIATEIEGINAAFAEARQLADEASAVASNTDGTRTDLRIIDNAINDAEAALQRALDAQANLDLDGARQAVQDVNEARSVIASANRRIRETVRQAELLLSSLEEVVDAVRQKQTSIQQIATEAIQDAGDLVEVGDYVTQFEQLLTDADELVASAQAAQQDGDLDTARDADARLAELLNSATSLKEEYDEEVGRIRERIAEANRPVLLANASLQERTRFYRGLYEVDLLDDPEISEDYFRTGAIGPKMRAAIERLNSADLRPADTTVTREQFNRISALADGPTPWENEKAIPLLKTVSSRSLWLYGINRQLGLLDFQSTPNLGDPTVQRDRNLISEFQQDNGFEPTGFFQNEDQLLSLISRPLDISVRAEEADTTGDWHFSQTDQVCIMWTYAKRIEGIYLRPDVPVVFLSKRKNEETPDLAISLGPANAFSFKPVNLVSNQSGSAPAIRVGSSLTLSTDGGFSDKTPVKMMFAARTISLVGESVFGGDLKIDYSARGFTASFKKIEDNCTLEVGFWRE